jgi:pimeloyl-ACP methyl ester carboxylesterase
VKVHELREDGLIGRLYEPATVSRHPAVLVLGGSEGGIPLRYAPLLASRGYVALALAYYYIDPLPKALSEIPLEYVDRGMSWLKHHRSVDPDRVGLIGISKGAELSLLLAAMHPRWFQAIVAISPSSVVWEAVIRNVTPDPSAFVTRNRSSWSYGGQPLPFLHRILTSETRSQMEKEGAADAIEVYSPALDDALTLERARIRVEEIKAPVLLIASKADRVWPSARMAVQVQRDHQNPGVRQPPPARLVRVFETRDTNDGTSLPIPRSTPGFAPAAADALPVPSRPSAGFLPSAYSLPG